MRLPFLIAVLIGLPLIQLFPAQPADEIKGEAVILLHGLARTERSMRHMARALEAEGYSVVNQGYPSTSAQIEELADLAISEALADPVIRVSQRVHFVTHSMGGILVRSYFARHNHEKLGRVVMLAPPNQGSEVVDRLRDRWLFQVINGPAGSQLGTDPDSVPNQLGKVDFELGVIAGNRSINWINSMMIHGPNDGKVSVTGTRVEGMNDHVTIQTTHPFIMRNSSVIRQTLAFLENGVFNSSNQSSRSTQQLHPLHVHSSLGEGGTNQSPNFQSL